MLNSEDEYLIYSICLQSGISLDMSFKDIEEKVNTKISDKLM